MQTQLHYLCLTENFQKGVVRLNWIAKWVDAWKKLKTTELELSVGWQLCVNLFVVVWSFSRKIMKNVGQDWWNSRKTATWDKMSFANNSAPVMLWSRPGKYVGIIRKVISSLDELPFSKNKWSATQEKCQDTTGSRVEWIIKIVQYTLWGGLKSWKHGQN